MNLTELADSYGSDKGSKKHRYTELYHMLFLPYRERAFRLLEMGLQIGGPEHNNPATRETTDVPSIRMWLEYFPYAEIVGLDISDFSAFESDRFTFVQCDMGERAQIAAATQEFSAFDIILDDASHASHHQQNAFLELFPKLAPGGLYIIEDLRWQPKSMERPSITKTAPLFQSFRKDRVFSHQDQAVADEFNQLAPEISGCFLFQAGFQKARRDQLVVVHKR